HARAGRERGQRPPAVRVDRGVRDRPRARDLGVEGDGPGPFAALLPQADGVAVRGGVRDAAADRVRAAPRRAAAGGGMSTRSRANPGGAKLLERMGEVRPCGERKPAWFKRPAPGGPAYRELRGMIESE